VVIENPNAGERWPLAVTLIVPSLVIAKPATGSRGKVSVTTHERFEIPVVRSWARVGRIGKPLL
jgi:hypothetical protein